MEIINLDMTPSTVTPNAHAGQYDASRTVRFMLKNGGVPFTLAGTETITAEITRSDNTEVTVNVANTSSNYVDVVFDDAVCTVKGLYACELRLKDSDGFDIGSKNFALLVQRDPYDGAGVHVETVGPADICTFETTLAEPLQSVLVNVLATGGNGTPDNPNPINGYTEANITANGDVITIAFGQTVYGGMLDVTRGRLHVTHGIAVFDGTEVYQLYGTTVVCNKYFTAGLGSHLDMKCSHQVNSQIGYANADKTRFEFRNIDTSWVSADLDAFKTFIATQYANGTPVQICYPLATPIDIDLTPEVISAVVGTNNVFADCGQTTVKYLKAGA